VDFFLVLLAAAELDAGAALGFEARKTGALQVVGAELDVRALLVVQVVTDL